MIYNLASRSYRTTQSCHPLNSNAKVTVIRKIFYIIGKSMITTRFNLTDSYAMYFLKRVY